ncbi:hypothetical protein GCM10023317_40830 [Actinopolymorpha pittospori]
MAEVADTGDLRLHPDLGGRVVQVDLLRPDEYPRPTVADPSVPGAPRAIRPSAQSACPPLIRAASRTASPTKRATRVSDGVS